MKTIYSKILTPLAILIIVLAIPKIVLATWIYADLDVAYTVTPASNVAPTVNAGVDQTVTIGSAISLPWTATDSDGIVSNTFWQLVSGPTGSNVSPSSTNPMVSNASGTASLTVTNTGTYLFRLNASDEDSAWGWDEVIITVNAGATQPDLTAGNPSPTTANVGVSTNFSSTISNIGTASTGVSFTNLFQFDNDADHGSVVANQTASAGPIAASGTDVATSAYTFSTTGTWYVRTCADNNASFVGTINEGSNEGNNCSGWVTVTVSSGGGVTASLNANPTSIPYGNSSTLTWSSGGGATSCVGTNFYTGVSSPPSGNTSVSPVSTTNYTVTCTDGSSSAQASATVTVTGGPSYQCSDEVDNDGDGFIDYDKDPGCDSPTDDDETDGGGGGGTQCSDGVDNADTEDALADISDPGCHTDGDVNNAASYDPNDNDEHNKRKPIFIEF